MSRSKVKRWEGKCWMCDDGIRELGSLGDAMRLRRGVDSGNDDTSTPGYVFSTAAAGSELVGRDLGGAQCLQ
ncbi:hypothetical protein LX36DRAFT_291324 [Colletotrichum falcatum]|nr:hypothetical protein LX36DRAFT_291324 [Colletotrichum falcatum]